MTTRFNTQTWYENTQYRKENGISALYCSPCPLAIPLNTIMYVIEMNNSTNQIEGIGVARNMCRLDMSHRVYEEYQDFNRYVFKGKYHMSREELVQINAALVEIIEEILFLGKAHYKRGRSMTALGKKFYVKLKSMSGDVLKNMCTDAIERNMLSIIKEIFRTKYGVTA